MFSAVTIAMLPSAPPARSVSAAVTLASPPPTNKKSTTLPFGKDTGSRPVQERQEGCCAQHQEPSARRIIPAETRVGIGALDRVAPPRPMHDREEGVSLLKLARRRCFATVAAEASLGQAQYTIVSRSPEYPMTVLISAG